MKPTEPGTYFIDKIPQPKSTEFKIVVGRKTESEKIPCKVLTTHMGKSLVKYSSGNQNFHKWIDNEQIVTV